MRVKLLSGAVLALLLNTADASVLPTCPGIYDPNTWHDCEGIYEHEDAFRYVGEFKNGKYHGKGSSTRMTGEKYVGEWKGGYKHGYGVMFLVSGGVWVGQWKVDKWISGKKYTEGWAPPEIYKLRD